MKRSKWLGGWPGTLLWILAAEAVGALSGFLTRDGAQLYRDTLEKPPLSPPGIVFPIVWSILYLLMGVSAARIARAGPSTARAKGLAPSSRSWPSTFSGASFSSTCKTTPSPSAGWWCSLR